MKSLDDAKLSPLLADLPETVQRSLSEFLEAAKNAFGSDLISVVLYGSAAEGKLRATSDVNLALVLSTFDSSKVDLLREHLRLGQASIQLAVMFILKSEIDKAADTFAVKFADIHRRRRVLHGEDVFSQMKVSREATISRVKQVLLNLTLRLRAVYAYQSLREEKMAYAIADFAGPLRTSAAAILEMEGQAVPSPKEALQKLTATLPENDWASVLAHVSEAREQRVLPPGEAGPTTLKLIELAQLLQVRAEKLH